MTALEPAGAGATLTWINRACARIGDNATFPENVVVDPSAALSALLRVAPQPLSARVVALATNHLICGQTIAERLGELSGRRFRLQVDDVPLTLTFEIDGSQLKCSTLEPHVTMRGKLSDFVALAMRKEDPDALFFQRRLVVEGETETGLHLKNLLDAWEFDLEAHLRAFVPAPLGGFTEVAMSGIRALRELSRLRRPGRVTGA
jgi:predicted lipid carrier protein YhbT